MSKNEAAVRIVKQLFGVLYSISYSEKELTQRKE